MFEGKIYECNGTNGRQGVAIMVSKECKEKTVTFNIARLATFLSFFFNFLSSFADMLKVSSLLDIVIE
jgi:hypothetical protein